MTHYRGIDDLKLRNTIHNTDLYIHNLNNMHLYFLAYHPFELNKQDMVEF